MGSSRREAMQLVHHAASLFPQKKKVDLAGRKEHLESLQSAVTRRAFIETCTAWTPNPVVTLDLDEPLRQRPCVDDLVVHRIETAYAKIVDQVRDRKSQQVKQRLEEESNKRESEANLLKHKPECLLVDLIDQRVSVKGSEAYGDDMAVEGGVPVVDQVASFVRSSQKWRIPRCGPGAQQTFQKERQNTKTDRCCRSSGASSIPVQASEQGGWKRQRQRQRKIQRKANDTISSPERSNLQFFSQPFQGLPIMEQSQVQQEVDQMEISGSEVSTGSWKGRKLLRRRTWHTTKQLGTKLPLECAQSKLMEMMTDATREDWAFLANFESLRHNLNVYNHGSRSVVEAGFLVPWPFIWLLTRFNRKHRFFLHDGQTRS